MSVCRRPKKVQVNGYALFRRQVQSEMKQQRVYMTDSELNDLTAKRWEDLSESQKSVWKSRAKEEKMNGRMEKAAAAVQQHRSSIADDDDFDYDDDDVEEIASVVTNVRKSSDSSTSGNIQQFKSFNGAAQDLPSYIFRPTTTNGVGKPQPLTLDPAPGPLSPIAPLPAPKTTGLGRGKAPLLVQPPGSFHFVAPKMTILAPRKVKERSPNVESHLKYIEEVERQDNPDKRRQSLRMSLISSFTWQYESDKEKLKDSIFYLLSSQKMFLDDDEEEDKDDFYVPAEICCSEFTIRDGLREKYCVLVKPPDSLRSFKAQIDHFGVENYGYNFEQLCQEGKSCDEIARHLLQMVKNRDNVCGNVKFFILGSEFRDVLKALDFVLRNSSLEECHKTLSPGRHLAHLDDLAQSFFNFFQVDYSNVPVLGERTKMFSFNDPIDLSLILKSLCIFEDGRLYGSSQGCPHHYKNQKLLEKAPICALRRQNLTVEIIKSSIEFGELSDRHIKSFAENSIDYYAENNAQRENIENGSTNHNRNEFLEENRTRMETLALESKISIPPPPLNLNNQASVDESTSFDSIGQNLNAETAERIQKYLASGEHPAIVSPSLRFPHPTERSSVDISSPVLDVAALSACGSIVPDTSLVQHRLSPYARGFGRGLHLAPENALLQILRVSKEF